MRATDPPRSGSSRTDRNRADRSPVYTSTCTAARWLRRAATHVRAKASTEAHEKFIEKEAVLFERHEQILSCQVAAGQR